MNDPGMRDFYGRALNYSTCSGAVASTDKKPKGLVKEFKFAFTVTALNPAAQEGVHGLRVTQQRVSFQRSELKVK